MAEQEAVTVIAVTYYSVDVIEQFLESLNDATNQRPRVVLVDNTPEDDGLAALVNGRPGVSILRPGRNLGYGAGMNFGVSHVGPEVQWLVLANPDLVVTPSTITTLLSGAARLPRAGALGPLIRNQDGSIYPSARKLPSLRNGIGHAIFVRIWPANPWTTSYRNDLAVIDEHVAGWLSGAFLLVRREAFIAVGGFDERYFMYFEDVDFGRNLELKGWLSYYVPSAEVTHLGAASTSRSARVMIRAHHESAYRYLAKRYNHWYLWPVRAVLWVGLTTRKYIARG